MLTPETTDAVLVIESVPPLDADATRIAIDDLAALVTRHLGGTAAVMVLDRGNPTVELSSSNA
jgi:DNA/RNA-binding domain of Phe-tRNA-synthetase-like protein